MKSKTTKKIIIENILLLLPLILYALFKNGYLIYERGLINFILIFKPLYLFIISILIKVIIDLIRFKKIEINYNLLYLILISLIMPYNINFIVYIISLILLYIGSIYLDKYFKINKVCLIYLIIILINSCFNSFTYLSPLELRFNFSFSFFDLLMGRTIGGISSTCLIASLLIYLYLINNYYYKRDIPLTINITYLLLTFIYYIFTKNNSYLLNSEVVFASIFVCTLPEYSPYKKIHQIIYGVLIGIITFIISILFNPTISIYIATLIISIFENINIKKLLKVKVK